MAKRAEKEGQKTVTAKAKAPEPLGWLCKTAELKVFKIENRPVSGIYFLCSNGRVTYVGQSRDIKTRIKAHQKGKIKSFDSAFGIRIPLDELSIIESAFIALLRPIHNYSDKKGCFVFSDKSSFYKYWEIGERLRQNQTAKEEKR